MGAPCELQIFAENQLLAKHCAKTVIADVLRLESKYSRYKADSYLSSINQAALNGGEFSVDEETAALLDYADTCYQQSDGLFDISSGILGQVWKFPDNQRPNAAQIQALLERVGWEKISWLKPILKFNRAGMAIDFGGIVKEYAADRTASVCHEMGVFHGVINLGGDIRIIGSRPNHEPWRIGIQHPRSANESVPSLSLSQGAVATSGDYARFMIVNGKRYGHILNPKTGWPVSYLASATVVADLCIIAGSASTIALLKEQQGAQWLESLGLFHICYGINGEKLC
jgi:thiamine biosynthesis lipoprotein